MSKITKNSATASRKSAASKAPSALTPILPPPMAPLDIPTELKGYSALFNGVFSPLEASRHDSARAVDAIMTATCWASVRQLDRQTDSPSCERTALTTGSFELPEK
jgi:hypothetical protein